MSILLSRPESPFWEIKPSQDQEPNPLNFRCAPNEATPDYVAYENFDSFVAYGFMLCWLPPHEYAGWSWLQRDDIRWLREHLLQALESVIVDLWTGDIELSNERYEQFDAGDFESFIVCDNKNEEYRTEEHLFQWFPRFIEPDGTIALDLSFSVLETAVSDCHPYSEEQTIWLRPEGYADRAKVREVLAAARKANWGDRREAAEPKWIKWNELLADRPES